MIPGISIPGSPSFGGSSSATAEGGTVGGFTFAPNSKFPAVAWVALGAVVLYFVYKMKR